MDFIANRINNDNNNDNDDSDSSNNNNAKKNVYTELDPSILPHLYLAYDAFVGGDSGKVHSTVKDRWLQRDPILVEGMKTLGEYADEAKDCLFDRDYETLAVLMRKNFAMRRKLYGDRVVGSKNIAMVELAESFNMSAKFTGSGGALLCLRNNTNEWFSEAEELGIKNEFYKHGFEFIRIEIPKK